MECHKQSILLIREILVKTISKKSEEGCTLLKYSGDSIDNAEDSYRIYPSGKNEL